MSNKVQPLREPSVRLREFTAQLESRLRLRNQRYILDYRCASLAVLGRHTELLRDPADPGWATEGRTTKDASEAKRWIRENYAARLLDELDLRRAGNPLLTVAQAANLYVAARKSEADEDSMELRSLAPRLSVVNNHVVAHLGDEVLINLTASRVQDMLDNLVHRDAKPAKESEAVSKSTASRKRKGRASRKRKAKATLQVGTKRNVLSALGAIWQHFYPRKPSPFATVRHSLRESRASIRKRLRAGDDIDDLRGKTKSYTFEEVIRILVAALFYDMACKARANCGKWYIANTAVSMAVAIACGLRINEVVLLQWRDIRWEKNELEIRGTKSDTSFRRVPLQQALRPWLELHLTNERVRLGREPNPNEPLFHTSKSKKWRGSATQSTMERRWRRVADIAELKLEGKNTHWARATFTTWMESGGLVPNEWVRFYLGHAEAFGAQTSTYLDPLKVQLPSGHTGAIALPDPSQLVETLQGRGEVDGFRPEWKSTS